MSDIGSAEAHEHDIRPVVRTAAPGNRTIWLFGAALALGAVLLFNTLNARREAMVATTTLPPGPANGQIASPPPLNLPPSYDTLPSLSPELLAASQPPANPPVNLMPSPQPVTRVIERMVPAQPPAVPEPMFQRTYPSAAAPESERLAPTSPSPLDAATTKGERVTAGRLLNPAHTVPQGTIVAAVLETALDSTRPGGARAIVSRDVRGFDGSRVLIPRGSRLYGEYASDVSAGQKRALVRWQRLTRPDGVIINIDSPAADPLGRAGIAGKVDSHFFERYGGAILQSALDIGVGVATRSVAGDSVILALPGNAPQISNQQSQIRNTLKVSQGTSVSVFVARDLDFSTVDR